MRHYIFCIFLLTAIGTQAQQVNPVPDYVFRNQMSVGRNAVTDTAAYISIGPRYGANKGLMPPIVSDTAAITGVKRNGLLIFSVQRNNFQYWDSINSRWTSVTANVDTTVISTRAWRKKGDDSLGAVIATRTDTTLLSTRAWRKKGDDSLGAVIATRTDTTLLSTRAWRQKGLDSLAAIEIDGSGTVNYVPKFTASRTLGNSQIFDDNTNIGIGTTNPAYKLHVLTSSGTVAGFRNSGANTGQILIGNTVADLTMRTLASGDALIYSDASKYLSFGTNGSTERMRIFANGRVGINTTTDAGYQFDVAGSIRNTTGAAFATSSGNVGVGTTSASAKLDVVGSGKFTTATNKFILFDTAAHGTYSGQGAAITFSRGSDGSDNMGAIFSSELTSLAMAARTDLMFATGGGVKYPATTERMRITSAGNVGIGTTSPSEVLHVVGRGRFTTIDSTSSPINVLTSDVNGVIRKTAPGVQGSGTTNYVAKFTASGTVGNSIITDNGTQVGIGTASPAAGYELDVIGDIRASQTIAANQGFNATMTSSGAAFTGATSATSGSSLVASLRDNSASQHAYQIRLDAGLVIHSATWLGGTGANMSHAWHTATSGGSVSERMRLTSDGELLINTTTDVGDYRLQVNGNANFRDDVLIDTNLRVNRHISLDQTPKAWALGNAIEGPQGSTLFVAGGGVQTLANVYYDGSYKYSTSNPGAAMFLLQSGITFATYGSGTANGALTGANEMVYAGGELRVGIADQGTFKLQVADKSYFGDEVQIASTTDLGNYKLQVTGEAIITAGIRTDAPSGGTAATWKLGTVATVSPTSPNRTIEVEIGGTTYYIHAKTTND